MSANSSPAPDTQIGIWRTRFFAGVILLVFSLMTGRLVQYQVVEHDTWTNRAVDNYTVSSTVPSPRGIIYDRNGIVLARNVASYNVVIVPAHLPDDDADIQRIYRELSEVIGVPVNSGTVDDAKLLAECTEGPGIAQLVELGDSNKPYSPAKIKCNVDDKTARIVREKALEWPGVSVQIEAVRDYPTGELTANVVGFLGPIPEAAAEYYQDLGFEVRRDKVGYAGAELAFDDALLGRNGTRVVEVDVAGQELRNLEPPTAPVPGNNLVLTIDTRLQEAARAALLYQINFWNTWFNGIRISSGAVIAMNPKTGEILAMVSYPTYENNRFARIIPGYYYNQLVEDPRHPLLNNAISSEYPPGSVFKLSTATGALNEGVVDLGTIIETPGKLTLTWKFSPNDPGREQDFVDWIYERNGVINPAGFGRLDFLHCIAYSSNVCFYKLGGGFKTEIPIGLGIDRLYQYARALGYDQPTGIELPGEQDGLIPTKQWKRITQGENWSTGDTYIASVGQGFVGSTPLQVLMSAATIANDGKQMKPTVVREIVDGRGQVVTKWFNPDDGTVTDEPAAENSFQISPFTPHLRWDITVDPLIEDYICDEDGYCETTGQMKIVQPWVVEAVQRGMRLAVTDPTGTLNGVLGDYQIAVAGKTGTAEYCDDVARANNRCQFGAWPTHAWTVAFAPFEDPEIVVVAFAYNAGEGGTVAAPIVADVIKAYFELKAIDISLSGGG
jgi:penicillin-binding protein 2